MFFYYYLYNSFVKNKVTYLYTLSLSVAALKRFFSMDLTL